MKVTLPVAIIAIHLPYTDVELKKLKKVKGHTPNIGDCLHYALIYDEAKIPIRLAELWKPGATAQVYSLKSTKTKLMAAQPEKGKWL